MPIEPVDQSESEKSLSDGVSKVFTAKKSGPTIKHPRSTLIIHIN